jgi:hypothetical protein
MNKKDLEKEKELYYRVFDYREECLEIEYLDSIIHELERLHRNLEIIERLLSNE